MLELRAEVSTSVSLFSKATDSWPKPWMFEGGVLNESTRPKKNDRYLLGKQLHR